MAHDATKVLLGSVPSTHKLLKSYPGNLAAGLAVSLDSSGDLSVDGTDGERCGVTVGPCLDGTEDNTVVCLKGDRVPMQILNGYNYYGVVTITDYANLIDDDDDTLTIGAVAFTAQAGAATPTEATFQAASSNAATATSLAAQINAHVATAALVTAVADGDVVYITADVEGSDGELTFAYDDVDNTGDSVGMTITGSGDLIAFTVTEGAAFYIDSDTGKICPAELTTAVISNSKFAESGILDGDLDGTNYPCALVNMAGGI